METFEYKGCRYRVNSKDFPSVSIPKIGIRTAGEILLDEEAQAYLVEKNCIGTVISLVEEEKEPAGPPKEPAGPAKEPAGPETKEPAEITSTGAVITPVTTEPLNPEST